MLYPPHLPPSEELSHVTDRFGVEKHINHTRNNSFYEFVPVIESTLLSLGWVSQLAAAWCGLRGCHVGCLPPLRLISRVHRDCEERPITSIAVAYNHFLSQPFAFALFAHTIIYLFIPFSCCFLLSALIFFFLDLWVKGPKWHWRRGHRHANTQTAHSKENRSTSVATPHLGSLIQILK